MMNLAYYGVPLAGAVFWVFLDVYFRCWRKDVPGLSTAGAVLGSLSFWLFLLLTLALTELAAHLLYTKTAIGYTEWYLGAFVAVVAGVTVILSFHLPLGETELELKSHIDDWKNKVVAEVLETRTRRWNKRQQNAARKLQSSCNRAELEDGLEHLAARAQMTKQDVLSELPKPITEVHLAQWIALADLEYAESMCKKA